MRCLVDVEVSLGSAVVCDIGLSRAFGVFKIKTELQSEIILFRISTRFFSKSLINAKHDEPSVLAH